jgi:RNA-directed DNA polymerase
VLDRFIQQALLQVLQPPFDPTFSDASYGFRPGRRAHDAVRRAQAYVQEGCSIVVDVDLEKFFDRVNHDILMSRLAKRIADRRVLRLIRRYLNAGVLANGVVIERHEGTPQGGPLSPLLANVLLDEVDKEAGATRTCIRALRRRPQCLCAVAAGGRAGDDLTAQAVRQAQAALQRDQEQGDARATNAKFLGFSFWIAAGRIVRRRVAPQAIQRMKERVRELTRRSAGRSLAQMCKPLGTYLSGWKAYFQLADTPQAFADIDGCGSAIGCGPCSSSTGSEAKSSIGSWLLAGCLPTPPDGLPPTAGAGGTTRRWRSTWRCRTISSNGWEFPNLPADLNPSNRPVPTRMPVGVAGDAAA